jgi:hypothetical protein
MGSWVIVLNTSSGGEETGEGCTQKLRLKRTADVPGNLLAWPKCVERNVVVTSPTYLLKHLDYALAPR